jgi:branched-chain amino acid transport system ATP-binding protein
MLEIKNLDVAYGYAKALHDISLYVETGQMAFLIGRNGAGKTTLFNVISGMKADSGSIFFKGEDIGTLKPHEICHRGIARTFQLVRPFTNLSVLENVTCGVLFGRGNKKIGLCEGKERAVEIIRLVKLDHCHSKRGKV